MPAARLHSSGDNDPTTAWIVAGLVGAMLLAWNVRSLLADTIFLADGFVLLGLDDSAYHARRSLYSFANFPAILLFDSYMAYPDGSAIPFPPLYDWTIAAVARLFGDSLRTFETVAAWAAVFLATATLLPIYGIGRWLLGPRLGIAAAWIFAILPASSLLSSVGYLDHHAAVAFLGTCWLWSSIREITDTTHRRALRWTLHGIIVAALVLTWSGSLLYIVVGEGARLLVGGVLWSRRERLWDQSRGAILAAVLVAPWVAAAPDPIDGIYSSIALSRLHVIVLLALGALTAGLALLDRLRGEPRWWMRGLRAVGLAIALTLPLLAIPGLLDTIFTALTFVSGQDEWAAQSPEQQPLFASTASFLSRSATVRFGFFAYMVPLMPFVLAALMLDRDRREAATLLLVWASVFSILALRQVRFAHDLAPLASVVFAGTLIAIHKQLERRIPAPAATLVSLGLALGLLWPALGGVHVPRARGLLHRLTTGAAAEAAILSPWESEARFAVEVRRLTPETSGYLSQDTDPRQLPEYSLLVEPSIGHSFLYWARRPVPANNFGQYLDRQKFDDVTLFYHAVDGTVAAEVLDRLDSRFVVTAVETFVPPMPYSQRLHRGDGYRGDDPVCGTCLRLITEGPPRGTPRAMGRTRRTFIPYKLFERVPGARIEVAAPPGERVQLELDLRTPLGRSLTFEVEARADDDGWARLRVPYATDIAPPVHATGPYRIRTDDTELTLDVPDAAVRSGATLTVDIAPDSSLGRRR